MYIMLSCLPIQLVIPTLVHAVTHLGISFIHSSIHSSTTMIFSLHSFPPTFTYGHSFHHSFIQSVPYRRLWSPLLPHPCAKSWSQILITPMPFPKVIPQDSEGGEDLFFSTVFWQFNCSAISMASKWCVFPRLVKNGSTVCTCVWFFGHFCSGEWGYPPGTGMASHVLLSHHRLLGCTTLKLDPCLLPWLSTPLWARGESGRSHWSAMQHVYVLSSYSCFCPRPESCSWENLGP